MKYLLTILCTLCLLAGIARAGQTNLAPDGCAFRPLNSGNCTPQGAVVAGDGRTYCAMDCTGTSQGFTVGFQWPADAANSATFKASIYASILSGAAGSSNTACISEKMACGSGLLQNTISSDNWLDSAVGQFLTLTDNQGNNQLWYTPSTGMTPVVGLGAPPAAVAGIQCYIRFDRVASGGGCTDNLSKTVRILSAFETH